MAFFISTELNVFFNVRWLYANFHRDIWVPLMSDFATINACMNLKTLTIINYLQRLLLLGEPCVCYLNGLILRWHNNACIEFIVTTMSYWTNICTRRYKHEYCQEGLCSVFGMLHIVYSAMNICNTILGEIIACSHEYLRCTTISPNWTLHMFANFCFC